jgi:hypothetical protein
MSMPYTAVDVNPTTPAGFRSSPDDISIAALVEYTLKEPSQLERLIRRPAQPLELVTRLLAIAVVGFAVHGAVLSLAISLSGEQPRLLALHDFIAKRSQSILEFGPPAVDSTPLIRLLKPSSLIPITAYVLGMIGAIGVCMPSFYFYGLLAGAKIRMVDVVLHALKCQATTAIVLFGLLPIYLAALLALIVFIGEATLIQSTLLIGAVLPFVAGLYGVASLGAGFLRLLDELPEERRGERRIFLYRLVLAWSAVYTAVTPIMIYTIWQRWAA